MQARRERDEAMREELEWFLREALRSPDRERRRWAADLILRPGPDGRSPLSPVACAEAKRVREAEAAERVRVRECG